MRPALSPPSDCTRRSPLFCLRQALWARLTPLSKLQVSALAGMKGVPSSTPGLLQDSVWVLVGFPR